MAHYDLECNIISPRTTHKHTPTLAVVRSSHLTVSHCLTKKLDRIIVKTPRRHSILQLFDTLPSIIRYFCELNKLFDKIGDAQITH